MVLAPVEIDRVLLQALEVVGPKHHLATLRAVQVPCMRDCNVLAIDALLERCPAFLHQGAALDARIARQRWMPAEQKISCTRSAETSSRMSASASVSQAGISLNHCMDD